MNFPQNHFVPQHLPTQSANPASQYKEPPALVGRVIRFSPSNYEFVCDYCMARHQNIGSFFLHTEQHFQRNEISIVMPSAMPPVCPTQNTTTAPTPAGTSSNTNGSVVPPYPVQLQHSTPMNQDTDYQDEIFEIIDLGYDFEGTKFPNAENIDKISNDQNVSQANRKSTQKRTPAKSKVRKTKPKVQRSNSNNVISSVNENTSKKCPFCPRIGSSESALKWHVDTAHAKIFTKIVCQKKAYKCKICDGKFPKPKHTLQSVHEHLKTHYSN